MTAAQRTYKLTLATDEGEVLEQWDIGSDELTSANGKATWADIVDEIRKHQVFIMPPEAWEERL